MMIRRRELWLVTSLMLVAFALRVVELTNRSIWLDEGTTLLRLSGSLVNNLTNVIYVAGERTIDTQPQLYFLLLQGFVTLGGEHEFIFRFFSVAFGVLCAPTTYTLARRMFDAPTAVLATLFVALSPGLIWYSREIRMYSLVPFLAAALTLAAYRCSRATQRVALAWLAWIALAIAGFLTHYSFVGLIAGQGAFLLTWTARHWDEFHARDRRTLIAAGASLAGAGLLALATPFVREVLVRLLGGQEMNYASAPIEIVVQTQFGGFLLGMNAFDFSGGVIGLVAGALCLATAVVPLLMGSSGKMRTAHALLAASVATPVVLWFALSFLKPNYQGFRHLILIAPMTAVLLARCCAWPISGFGTQSASLLWRTAGTTMGALIVGLQLYGVAATFIRTPHWQDDWRALAHYVRDHWQPGDVLVIGGLPTVAIPITPYLRGVPWFQEDGVNAPAQLPPNARRVWYVDRGRGQPRQLNGSPFIRREVNFPARSTAITLRLLELDPPFVEALPAEALAVDGAAAADMPRLAAYALSPGAPLNPQPNTSLTLYWQRPTTSGAGFPGEVNVAFRLRYGDAVWLDANVRADLDVIGAWPTDGYFRTEHIVPIPMGLPALPYHLEMSVLAGDKQERIQHVAAPLSPEAVACCIRVTIWPAREQPMTIAAVAAPQPPLVLQPARIPFPPLPSFGDIRISVVERPASLHPGEPLPVVLTWLPARADLTPWQSRLTLQGLLGGDLAATQRVAGTPDFPVEAWPTGEPVRDQYVLDVPFSAQPGWYRLQLERWRDGRRVDGAFLGLVRIEDYPPMPVAAQVQHPANARVGELSLLGYSVNGPVERGRTHNFITHWRVEQTPARDGVLFLHLFGPDGRLVSQDDNPPTIDGKVRSTLTYHTGEGINQIHRITLPADSPAGEYKLFAGIYDRDGGLRWPAQQDGRPARDDLIFLGVITLN
ncbi:MAG: hypothetical protein CUN48_10565 [Candidatus Thermofonsia Clade 3 bacterium]|uniref:Glycosyltransferase RgtA/B/C/D-like domain-containing protein n=1 Tax=Candidatus Thermofonsia Clade 3 bacterium TaxID=2364212 RepID=A0A2M8QB94_9CHLR|nr:MAG: hypothetical protein CUN48_10565 [Candidatus Thermofonsia Clade 3 bacterium]